MLKIMGEVCCKLDQLFKEPEGSFREYICTNSGFVHMYNFLAVSRLEDLPESQQFPYLTVAPSNGGEQLVNGCT